MALLPRSVSGTASTCCIIASELAQQIAISLQKFWQSRMGVSNKFWRASCSYYRQLQRKGPDVDIIRKDPQVYEVINHVGSVEIIGDST